MRRKFNAFPVLVLFIAIIILAVLLTEQLESWNVDFVVLMVANGLLFFLSMVSYFLAQKGVKNPNPHAFVRSVYSSVFIKLFVIMIAVFIYLFTNRDTWNKPAIFISMGLYLVYTFVEVYSFTKRMKKS